MPADKSMSTQHSPGIASMAVTANSWSVTIRFSAVRAANSCRASSIVVPVAGDSSRRCAPSGDRPLAPAEADRAA